MTNPDGGHTVLGLLNKSAAYLSAKGSPSPRLDAELLLAHVLDCSRIALYVGFDRPLGAMEVDSYRQVIIRRGRREPIAYITGQKEFMGRGFCVGKGTLVPRPETEMMAEKGIEALEGLVNPIAAELCCGSGALGISVALARPNLSMLMSDISDDCLCIAKMNAEKHQVADRVRIIGSDLFDDWPEDLIEKIDLIMANPPYIPSGDIDSLEPEVSVHEPRLALDGGLDGLSFYRRIAAQAKRWLKPGGAILLEIGHDQAAEVTELLTKAGFSEVSCSKDLQGYDRLLKAIG